MKKDPKLAEQLNAKIKSYQSKDYIRELSSDELKEEHNKIWYLPVFPVFNPNKPTKVRIVWDAAAKTKNMSLNSMLLKGPDLLTPLNKVLYGFRENAIGITADIEEMFHQIQIKPEDQHAQRFLWSFNDEEPKTFVMKVMTFGASCSPFCAQYVKNVNASEFQDKFIEAVKAIKEKHYVDDYLDSFESEEKAIEIAKQVQQIHKHGGSISETGFQIQKT